MSTKNTVFVLIIAAVILLVLGFSGRLGKRSGPASSPESSGSVLSCTTADSGIVKVCKNAKLGDYLTDSKNTTLYVFANDKKESTCYDKCLENWSPFPYDNKDLKTYSDELDKRLNIVKRKDGSYQYAYGEKPLYYFKGDKKAGDITGADSLWGVVIYK